MGQERTGRIKLAPAVGGGPPKAVRSGAVGQKQSKEEVAQALNRWKRCLGDATTQLENEQLT
eukprot:SAG22_NODE_160_length_16938_cov_3.491241_11_plen_62_part_00